MRIPTFIEKLPSGLIVAIQWNCGCAWDVDVGQVICEMHQEESGGMKGDSIVLKEAMKRIGELEEEKAYAIEQWRMKVRELEAEVIVQKSAVMVGIGEMVALTGRAENAEARVRELEAELIYWKEQKRLEDIAHGESIARAENAEARVAELLEAIRQHDEYCPDECEYLEGGRWLKEQPEAREREAE